MIIFIMAIKTTTQASFNEQFFLDELERSNGHVGKTLYNCQYALSTVKNFLQNIASPFVLQRIDYLVNTRKLEAVEDALFRKALNADAVGDTAAMKFLLSKKGKVLGYSEKNHDKYQAIGDIVRQALDEKVHVQNKNKGKRIKHSDNVLIELKNQSKQNGN